MKSKPEYGFGSHLIVELEECKTDQLPDKDFVFSFLNTFPDKIKLTTVSAPQVFKYDGQFPDDAGISGVVLIAESHISIHTFPEKKRVLVDIFSCGKDFDIDYARAELMRTFKSAQGKVKLFGNKLEG